MVFSPTVLFSFDPHVVDIIVAEEWYKKKIQEAEQSRMGATQIGPHPEAAGIFMHGEAIAECSVEQLGLHAQIVTPPTISFGMAIENISLIKP